MAGFEVCGVGLKSIAGIGGKGVDGVLLLVRKAFAGVGVVIAVAGAGSVPTFLK